MSTISMCDVDSEFHVLIPSRFPPVPLYTRLGGSEIQRAAERVEEKTNPRLRAERRLSQSTPLVSQQQLQNWNLAPLAYPNPQGSTFLRPGCRVLQMVKGVHPALVMAVRRREKFLSNTAEPAIRVEMRLIVRQVTGRFADLTETPFEPNTKARRQIGEEIYDTNAQGILFILPDLGNILGIEVFDGGVLGRAIQSEHYRFDWDGHAITKIGNLSTREVIERDTLFADVVGGVPV